MTEDFGAIITRRPENAGAPPRPGEEVFAYVLLAPLPPVVPGDESTREHDAAAAHRAAAELAPEAHALVKAGTWRVQEVHRCTCRRGRVLVTESVSPTGQRWALLHWGESIPPAHKQIGDDSSPKAWPLHREPTGAPHVDLIMCGKCDKTWAVALTDKGVTLIPTRPQYGVRVTQ